VINHDRFAPLIQIAKELGISSAQLALAWILHQGKDVFPIPGTRRAARIDENAKAASVRLSSEVLHRITALAQANAAVGSTLV
jgi:aryl-alcohol dehydrogenase-like predicted oxidoreductase